MPAQPRLSADSLAEAAPLLAAGAFGQQRLLFGLAAARTRALARHFEQPALSASLPPSKTPAEVWADAAAYAVDSAQRHILFWDTMRRAGTGLIAHERQGCPPVLAFDYAMVMDGRRLARPVNYALVRIRPPEGYAEPDPALQPFVIIDPRAGQGAGIGGFKSDSAVGVALRAGHPVYFVIFFPEPEPGQTILDITAAERDFLREVARLHPGAARPVVIGNCQGGWAAMLLGASAPELVGPLVLNGAPLSYWAGRTGQNPMRYVGGVAGGSWLVTLMSDLGNGRFDGAHLSANFEFLSPGKTWLRKYHDLYSRVDTEAERFLDFERWWSGLFLMNREEIRWIADNLFIGNRLARDEVVDERGAPLSIRNLRSPVIVFASKGDHITPPGQALRWIAQLYRDEREIKLRGQTIVYLLHENVGHLGIFVSGAVARREHSGIASTLGVIEAVAPGLYEMRIAERDAGGWQVELEARTMEDIRALSGGDEGQAAFAAVAEVSAIGQRVYEAAVAPVLRAAATEPAAELGRRMHPLRLRRYMTSDANPAMLPLPAMAEATRTHRVQAAPDNLFLAAERSWADSMERALDAWRDMRDAATEAAFFGVYGWLSVLGFGRQEGGPPAQPDAGTGDAGELRALAREGGYAEAVIRMLVLLAQARGGVRRSRLARSRALLLSHPPFSGMGEEQRQEIIRTQTMLAEVAPAESLDGLAALLPGAAPRRRALAAVLEVAGPRQELGDAAGALLARMEALLGAVQDSRPGEEQGPRSADRPARRAPPDATRPEPLGAVRPQALRKARPGPARSPAPA